MFFQFERAAALIGVAGIERRFGIRALERLDDSARIRNRGAIELQYGDMRLARHSLNDGNVEPRNHRMADVRHALEIQGSARLLVEIRAGELPQLRSIHEATSFRDAGRAITYNFVTQRLQYCQ